MISFTEWQTPDTPLAVVADATDGAGHVGAMVMPSTVKHAAVAAVEVPTVDIVHVPVAVVVDTIACDLAGVLARELALKFQRQAAHAEQKLHRRVGLGRFHQYFLLVFVRHAQVVGEGNHCFFADSRHRRVEF